MLYKVTFIHSFIIYLTVTSTFIRSFIIYLTVTSTDSPMQESPIITGMAAWVRPYTARLEDNTLIIYSKTDHLFKK